ncbi:MAG: VOC family protein [Actinomycetota bacterium]
MTVKPIPDGYHSVIPYLAIRDAGKALDFYRQAFGAEETVRMAGPDGKIGHAEKVFDRAVAAGATSEQAVEDKFFGDRAGSLRDPFGHRWFIHTHVEDVPPDEMAKRAQAAMEAGMT